MSPNKITSITVMAIMCTVSPLSLKVALAQETQPGDVCAAGELGYFKRAADDTPGPGIEGQNFMFCDGANWLSFLQYDNINAATILRTPNAAPADGIFNNSHWSLWLDEVNDEFELKGKKSDGTVISATVGAGGTGLWTDNTTYISETSSGTHLIKAGQTLPAALDDIGTRMFFYPDKAAFRGGVITSGDTAWQEGNIGTNSFAWGENPEASGANSIALGRRGEASGNRSFAAGSYARASGSSSVALGSGNTASYTYAVAIGYSSNSTGTGSVAIGTRNTSSGRDSVAIGNFAVASGNKSVAIGHQIVAGNGANELVGQSSMAFGLQSANHSTDPRITGNRTMALFFDGGVNQSNDSVNITAEDSLIIHGGRVGIGLTATPSVELDVVGDIEFTGTITDVSDRRLKTDINNLPSNQLHKILDLQGVSFKMKNDIKGPVEFGFIAQDVQLLYPELIYERDDGMFSMNYVGLIAPMVEAMEEQNGVIEKQKSRIGVLEDRLKSLEEKFQNMTVHGFMFFLLTFGFY